VLLVQTTGGESIPIHVFGDDDYAPLVAAKAGQILAAMTGRPFEPNGCEIDESIVVEDDLK
jgi:hypothetical protein